MSQQYAATIFAVLIALHNSMKDCIAQLNERRRSWQKLVPHDSLGGSHLKEGGRVGSCPPQRCLLRIQQTAVISGVSLLSAACTLCSMRSLLTCLLRTCMTAYAAASSWHYKINSAITIWQVQTPPAKKPQSIPIQHVPWQFKVFRLAYVLLDDPVSVYVRLHQEPTWVELPGLELARLNQIMLQMERDAKTVEGCTRSTPAPEETLLGVKIAYRIE